MNALLERLHISDLNPGACHGPDGWSSDPAAGVLTSYNPTTGAPIAQIAQVSAQQYDAVVDHAQNAFQS